MRLPAVALFCAMVVMAGCEDDPIIGPGGEDDTGGGSYGVIHFNTRPEAPDTDAEASGTRIEGTPIEATRTDTSSDTARSAAVKTAKNDNPKRF